MPRIRKSSTPAAGGTPWQGRLRSYHASPQSSPPQQLPSCSRSREAEEEPQTSKKRERDTPKTTRRGASWDEDAGAARPPKAPLRRSPRLAGRDPEYPLVIVGADKKCKGRGDQSAITPLRRSPRFHTGTKSSVTELLTPNPQQTAHNRKPQNVSRKDKDHRNVRSPRNVAAKTLSRTKMPKKPSSLDQTSQDIPPQQKHVDVSRKMSEEKDLKADHCEVQTNKRKRVTKTRCLSEIKGCQNSPSVPLDCQEAAPNNDSRKQTCNNRSNVASFVVIGDMKLMTVKENNESPTGIEREGKEPFCAQDDWTEEQDIALHQAYFSARPSPHFWKRVSKMVPGRSAEECFNRIHADLSTPTPIAPRPRRCKAKFSPVGNFSLSDSEVQNLLEPTVGRKRTTKQTNLAAQKTVRHLLQKHCLIDQAQGADHFSLFEPSPSALELNFSFEDSPGTPRSCMDSGSLRKSSASSSARKKPFSRFRTKQDEPSPAVLKPVKNTALHERYINQLFRREDTKRPRRRATGSKAADAMKAYPEQQPGNLKAAKNALFSEATDFISHFKNLQLNALANVEENSEDDSEFDTEDE